MNHSRIRPLPSGKRIPPFLPVPLIARRDGWSAIRQGDFIGFHAETGSVTRAAAEVGMSRASAYKLRTAPGARSFVAAWDAACGNDQPPRKLTFVELQAWAFAGPIVIHLRGGRYVGHSRKPNTTALLRVLAYYDRMCPANEVQAW